MEREKRSTAGRRMTTLVGKALEDDEAFWGHDTWNENESSDEDNQSFHSSDEDSSLKKDEFDSDFNDSESETEIGHDDDEVAKGQQAEHELQQQERKHFQQQKQQHSKRSYVDVKSSSSTRAALLGSKGKNKLVGGKKAVTGDGLNAGIVLNVPSSSGDGVMAVGSTRATTTPHGAVVPSVTMSSSASLVPSKVAESPSTTTAAKKKVDLVRSIARTRQRRSITKPKRAAALQQQQHGQSSSSAVASPPSPTSSSSSTLHKRKRRHQQQQQHSQSHHQQQQVTSEFTQEQLLLEAVHETEPENERWLLARKRRMQDVEHSQEQLNRLHNQQVPKGTIIEKFVSRRGHLNVITFPEMDHVPAILTQTGHKESLRTMPQPTLCVITGKVARYRDPKTGYGYYDVASFQEIRRRLANGEPIVVESDRNNSGISATITTIASTDDSQAKREPSADPATTSLSSFTTVANDSESKSNSLALPVAPTITSSSSKSKSAPLRIHIRAPMSATQNAATDSANNPNHHTVETKLNSSPSLRPSDSVSDVATHHPPPWVGDLPLASTNSNSGLAEPVTSLAPAPSQPSKPHLTSHTEQSVIITMPPTVSSNGSTVPSSATASSTANGLPTTSIEPIRIPRKASFHQTDSCLPEKLPESAPTLALSLPSHSSATGASSDNAKEDVERRGTAIPTHGSPTSSRSSAMVRSVDPPSSPRRASPRRHKPSAKLLENAANLGE